MKKNMLKYLFYSLALAASMNQLSAQETERQWLSGTGNDQMVNWQFFCTAGNHSGKWTEIGVPSCWELQGFGKYDYGFAKDSARGKEQGLYKHHFKVPSTWKNKVIKIVFEGVMTDAEVRLNGISAGPTHQGAFYSFSYDITRLIRFDSDNLLEITVSKHSANPSVNAAERKADFWLFGGIFRPVFLEAMPQQHMETIAVDARADGQLKAQVQLAGDADRLTLELLDQQGKPFGTAINTAISQGMKQASIMHGYKAPKLWSAEFPHLYQAVFSLYKQGKLVHRISKKIGFRTVEVKQRDGIYVNGVKMKLKGVNRHSFWPTSGRTTSKSISLEDVRLMKEMNMNAVRMSHYPPDAHFLEVCDSLGLYVMDELAGWHGYYDTRTGTSLMKEMIAHDVNHPSIIIWSNGNEGGHNLELDSIFPQLDIQKRPVVHPWQLFGGIETQHYREYNYGIGNYENGHDILLPTEFLHGLYDGGHGAGLEDYWESIWHNPLAAGGYLWDFADEGVMRTDQNGKIDTDGNHGADGIVGPFHEKEGSFFAIKEIWSPVHFEKREITDQFDGYFNIENRYAFTNLDQCRFSYKLATLNDHPQMIAGKMVAPSIKPFDKGKLHLALPLNWHQFDVLYITVNDPYGKEVFTFSFPIRKPSQFAQTLVKREGDANISIQDDDSLYLIKVNSLTLTIHKQNGMIDHINNAGQSLPFGHGPILQEAVNNFSRFNYHFEGKNLIIQSAFDQKKSYNTLQWTIYPSGWIKMKTSYFPAEYFTLFDGVNFSFPEKQIRAVEYLGKGPYRVWKNRMKGGSFGIWNKKYNDTETGETWNYPEFKGYHANLYWAKFITDQQPFTVVTEDEDVFMRLFTPAFKTDPWKNYEPLFPSGDISFMQGIPSIGTKTQRNETTGPMGMKNIFYDYEKDPARAKQLTIYFNFNDH